jgi:hypothetical protein
MAAAGNSSCISGAVDKKSYESQLKTDAAMEPEVGDFGPIGPTVPQLTHNTKHQWWLVCISAYLVVC